MQSMQKKDTSWVCLFLSLLRGIFLEKYHSKITRIETGSKNNSFARGTHKIKAVIGVKPPSEKHISQTFYVRIS